MDHNRPLGRAGELNNLGKLAATKHTPGSHAKWPAICSGCMLQLPLCYRAILEQGRHACKRYMPQCRACTGQHAGWYSNNQQNSTRLENWLRPHPPIHLVVTQNGLDLLRLSAGWVWQIQGPGRSGLCSTLDCLCHIWGNKGAQLGQM